jgi:hypothetical protein
LALLALAAAWSLILGGTLSAYTATTATSAGSLAAAADWVAPTASTAVVGRSTATDTGSIAQGSTYYLYANASDTGNPASGITSVSANLNSISAGKTAVALTAGTYSAGGVGYGFRSPSEVAANPLASGSYAVGITSTDGAANSGTQSFNMTVSNTALTASDVQSTNVAGGTVGHLDLGDTLTLTYSQAIDPNSVLAGWNGSANTSVEVVLVGGGGNNSDYIQFSTADSAQTRIPLGQVTLGSAGYLKGSPLSSVTYGGLGAGTATTMTRNGANITFTLGSPSGGPSINSTAANMIWAPSASVTDIAGNAASTASATQSGTAHVNF